MIVRWLALYFISNMVASAAVASDAADLKLLISIEQPAITAPFPARVTLHLHNAGRQKLWIYSPVGDKFTATSEGSNPFFTADLGPNLTSGGSTLEASLVAANASSDGPASPADAKIFETVGLPHPKLIPLEPGGDFDEKTVIGLSPASAAKGEEQPWWGRYKLSVTYRAQYSNASNLERILGADLWEGEVISNTLDVELRPPPEGARGSVTGTVAGADLRPTPDARITLSDRDERVLGQTVADENGKFVFAHLPAGWYWVTGQRRLSTEDTTVFRHVVISPAEPAGTVEFALLSQDVYDSRRLLHKPVLFRVVDPEEKAIGGVELEFARSSGTILEKVKGRTAENGMLELELIPGRNFVTLRRSGCPKQEERVDVAPGGGIDGFKIVLLCAKR